MKNTAVTEFILALATVVFAGMFAIGCGGDPADANVFCNDPYPDEDGGNKSDGGDATTGDTGSGNTEPSNPCDGYEWINKDFDCSSATTHYQSTCKTWAEADVCYAKCTNLFNKRPMKDTKFVGEAGTADNKFQFSGPGCIGWCTEK